MDEGNDTMAAVKEPSLLPEMEMFAYLLVLMFLLDHKQYKEVSTSGQPPASQGPAHFHIPNGPAVNIPLDIFLAYYRGAW